MKPSSINPHFTQLSQQLDLTFHAPELLQLALTHRSAGSPNNERLEYLGDAVLGLVISEMLFKRLRQAKEGQLSRVRASMVRRETLAQIARQLQLGDVLILGPGEMKSGGHKRDSILADALEAIIGALFEDQGFDASKAFILRIFEPYLNSPHLSSKDAKSRLQEYLQSRQLSLPEYSIIKTTGNPHNQHFLVQCRIDCCALLVEGEGASRRIAEQSAARIAIEQLQT